MLWTHLSVFVLIVSRTLSSLFILLSTMFLHENSVCFSALEQREHLGEHHMKVTSCQINEIEEHSTVRGAKHTVLLYFQTTLTHILLTAFQIRAVMRCVWYLPGKANLACFHSDWDQRWFMCLGSVSLSETPFMWTKHVPGFNGIVSRVDLFVVYRHTVDRSLLVSWGTMGRCEHCKALQCADTRAVPSQAWCETWAGCTVHEWAIVITADLTGLACQHSQLCGLAC